MSDPGFMENLRERVAECDRNGFTGFFNIGIYVDEAKALLATPHPAPERVELVEKVTQAILREAREFGADSPVDRGDAEQLARAAIALLPLTSEREGIVAYLRKQASFRSGLADRSEAAGEDETANDHAVRAITLRNAAEQIERGDHLDTPNE